MVFRLTTTALAALSACLLAAQAGHAQDTSLSPVEVRDTAPDPGRIRLDAQPATASRLGLSIRETPGAVYQVDRAAIEAQGARDTQEILRAVPGLTAAQAQGGAAGFVAYRGFNGSQITQLFNGIAVQYDVVSARPVDSWIYDRVEVIGGPSSFLFGAGAVGGSINYLTKLPERGNFSDAQLRVGSFGSVQASAGLNRQLAGDGTSGHFLRLDVNTQTRDGYVDGNRNRSQQVAASLLSDLTPQLSHTLALEYLHEDEKRPYFGTPLLNPTIGEGRILPQTRFTNYNTGDGQYEQTVKWFRSLLDYRLSDTVRLKNTLYRYEALRDYRNVEEYAFNAANTRVTRFSPLLQRHDQELTGDRVELTFKQPIGALASDWAAGLDYSVNKQTRFPNGPVVNVSTVDPTGFTVENFFSIPGLVPGFNPDRTVRVTTLALFLENRTRLTPVLSLVTGLRRDRIDLDLTNRGTVTAANPATLERGYNATTGRIGLVLDVAPGANVYALYSTAADPPAGILTTASFAQARTNTELTRGRQFEIGAKADLWDGRATVTAALYHIERRNLATTDPANRLNTVLVGEQSARGFEVAGSVRLTSELTAQANASWVDPQYDNFQQTVGTTVVSRAGNTPPNTPRQVFNVGMSYAFVPGWQASFAVRHVGKVYGDIANTLTAPGYTLLDLGLAYRFNKSVSLSARVRNATDKVYASYVSLTPMFTLGEPRAADLTLRVNF